MAKAFSYIRFSDASQSKGSSYERQMRLTKAFCAKHNLTLDEKLFFDAISAWKGANRTIGALSEFLRLVDDGKIPKGSYLLIEKLDRLSRDDVSNILPVFTRIIKSGIYIATTEPERIYDKKSLEGMAIIEPILHFIFANEESQKKSDRLRFAWAKRRQNIAKQKLTAVTPFWLKLVDNEFIEIKSACDAIRLIFDLALKGHGYRAITTYLNNKKIKPFGRSKIWAQSYINKLMYDKRLIGELAPRSVSEDGTVKPTGEVIENYYPVIIPPTTFYQVQQFRKPQIGRIGDSVANLFTGCIFDARDKSPMNITARGIYMSSAALANKPNTIQQGFRYEWVEQYILMFLHELLPTLKSLDKPNTAPELERIRKDIVEKHNFCEKLKDQIKRTMSMTFADMLLEAENDLKALQAEEIKLLSETSFAELDYDLTNKSPEFRSKLKVAISRLLDKSYIIVFEQPDRSKVCLIQLHIKGMAHPKQICLRHKYHTDKVFFSWSYRRKWEPKKDSPQPPADYFTKPWTGQDLRYYPWTDASQSEQWEEAQADKALLERRKRIAAKRKGIK